MAYSSVRCALVDVSVRAHAPLAQQPLCMSAMVSSAILPDNDRECLPGVMARPVVPDGAKPSNNIERCMSTGEAAVVTE